MGIVTVISGPPCSGKSTLVAQLAAPEDLVLDFDRIALRLGSPRPWNHPPQFIAAAEQYIRSALRSRGERSTWLIRAAPRPVQRERLAAALDARVWVLDPGREECLRRARSRPNTLRTAEEIRKWYRMFRPSPVDGAPPPNTASATTSSEART